MPYPTNGEYRTANRLYDAKDLKIMNIPQSVLDQGKRSDELIAKLQQEKEHGNQADPPPVDPPPVETPPEEQKTPVQENPNDIVPEESVVDWKHKYDVLQGIHQKDIQASKDHIEQLRRMNESMQVQLDRLTQSAQKKEQKDPDPFGQHVDQFQEDFGEDAGNMIKNLMSEINQLKQHIGGVQESQQKSSEQSFQEGLESAVPNVWKINEDPVWVNWLQEMEPMSGRTRHELLTDAYNDQNVRRVASFFNAFTGRASSPIDDANVNQQPTPDTRRERLEKQITPGKGRPSTPQNEQPTFTRADIQKFYKDASMGKYARDPKEYARIEKQIEVAHSEGRIT